MLTKDPIERISIPEILNHPWMTHFQDEDFGETDL